MSQPSSYGTLVDARKDMEDSSKTRSAPYEDNPGSPFRLSHSANLQIEFEEIFNEPDGTKSIPQVYKISRLTYTYTKNIMYIILTVLLSTILAFVWAIIISLIAFFTVWIINPLLQLYHMFAKIVGTVYSLSVSLFCDPLCYSAGLVFSRFKHTFFFKPYPKALTDV